MTSKLRPLLFLIATTLTLASGAQSTTSTPALNQTVTDAQPKDPTGPSAQAYVQLNPAGEFIAKLKVSRGEAVVKEGAVTAKKVIIDLKSLSTGLALRDTHAKEKYLQVNQFPEAILIEASGKDGVGEGRLKFHGKENPIKGTYTIEDQMLKAEFAIKLSEFGITNVGYKGIGVKDDVEMVVEIPIAKPKKLKSPKNKKPKRPDPK